MLLTTCMLRLGSVPFPIGAESPLSDVLLLLVGECVSREPLRAPIALFLEESLPYQLVYHVIELRVSREFLDFEHILMTGWSMFG